MICDLLALRPISHITKKTLSYLHSTKIEQMTKTMVIFKRGAIFLCCIRCDPIPPQTSVQRLAHTRNVTTCCCCSLVYVVFFYLSVASNYKQAAKRDKISLKTFSWSHPGYSTYSNFHFCFPLKHEY